MKLFLSSIGINNAEELYKLIGKRQGIKTALITNAFELKSPEDRKIRYDLVMGNLGKLNLDITEVDLKNYINNPTKLKQELAKYDFIWANGGNVFYLRMLMQQSGFDKIIKDLVDSGMVYGGDSAGAIVAGVSLHGFERADHIDQVPTVIYEGLDLIDFVPLPHWGNQKFKDALDSIKEDCEKKGLNFVVMTDNQAMIVEDGIRRLINNPLSN